MKRIDRILENIQKEIELYGTSGPDCVFKTNIQFTIKREDFDAPMTADVEGAICDVSWFFKCAKERMIVPCGNPDTSFFTKYFGETSLPYGATWNVDALVDNLTNNKGWRRAILFNHQDPYRPPCVVSYQFQETKYKTLDCTVTMRSIDVAKVLATDVFMCGLILDEICEKVGMDAGDLTFNIANAHVYYEDLEYTEEFTIDYGD
jgi:hypothetical protein